MLHALIDIICAKQLVFRVFENNIFVVGLGLAVAKKTSLTQINPELRLFRVWLDWGMVRA